MSGAIDTVTDTIPAAAEAMMLCHADQLPLVPEAKLPLAVSAVVLAAGAAVTAPLNEMGIS